MQIRHCDPAAGYNSGPRGSPFARRARVPLFRDVFLREVLFFFVSWGFITFLPDLYHFTIYSYVGFDGEMDWWPREPHYSFSAWPYKDCQLRLRD